MTTASTEGHWINVSTALPEMGGLNTKCLTWGHSANPWGYPSGYLFEGVNQVPVPLDGTQFKVGTFYHSNFTIAECPQFSTTLSLAIRFFPGWTSRGFSVTFSHIETPNVGDGNNRESDDLVQLPILQAKETVVLDGIEYALHLNGFLQNGALVTTFRSPESKKNSADVVAKLVSIGPKGPPPGPKGPPPGPSGPPDPEPW